MIYASLHADGDSYSKSALLGFPFSLPDLHPALGLSIFSPLRDTVTIRKLPKVSCVIAAPQLSVVLRTNNGLREILSLSISDNGIRTYLKLINAELPALA